MLRVADEGELRRSGDRGGAGHGQDPRPDDSTGDAPPHRVSFRTLPTPTIAPVIVCVVDTGTTPTPTVLSRAQVVCIGGVHGP
jgi:hypothetical protein